MLDDLPQGRSFNSEYFRDHLVAPLRNLPILHVAQRHKKVFVLHIDNPPLQKSKSVVDAFSILGIQRAPHQPYSPDLDPSDSFLFEYLKEQMGGREFDSPADVLEWVREVFQRIGRDTIERVFEEWIRQVQQCIERQGAYFPEE
jgi:histone-lysine N-methyltransferase SETMAR